jgi:hypothetical protein
MKRRRHVPKPDRRRALEWLAGDCDGCTEAIMIAHGTDESGFAKPLSWPVAVASPAP